MRCIEDGMLTHNILNSRYSLLTELSRAGLSSINHIGESITWCQKRHLMIPIPNIHCSSGLRRYERISIENRRFRSNRVCLTLKFHVEGSSPPTILLVRKLS